MEKWVSVLDAAAHNAELAIVAANNNHYAGFGPASANEFREMLRMDGVVRDEIKQARL
jgi:hypothetical protein